MPTSPNFGFLSIHDSQLVRLGALAEKYFADDPNTCLIKLRQFGEVLAQLVAANVGLYTSSDEKQIDLLRRLSDRGVIKGDVERLFHELRKAGNEATHSLSGSQRVALSGLKYARFLGIWFHRVFGGNRTFDLGAFVPPPDPVVETEALRTELAQLRAEFQATQSEAQAAQVALAQEAQRRLSAEELAREAGAQQQELLDRLSQVQATAASTPQDTIQQTIVQAQVTERGMVLDERETRRLIDAQLRAAGWEGGFGGTDLSTRSQTTKGAKSGDRRVSHSERTSRLRLVCRATGCCCRGSQATEQRCGKWSDRPGQAIQPGL
jgi:type I restriction enzyme R subunit